MKYEVSKKINNSFLLNDSTMKKTILLPITLIMSLLAQAQLYNNGAALSIGTNGILQVNTAFTNKSGSNLVNNGSLNIKGNLTNEQTMAVANNGTLKLEGTSTQTISGTATFLAKNVTFNNAAGVTISKSLKADGEVKFQSGMVTASTSSEPMAFGTNGTVSTTNAPSNSSHVNGYVSKEGTGAFDYPVGDGTRYQKINTNLTSNNTGILVKYYPSDAGAGTFATTGASSTPLFSYNQQEYWDISPISSASGTVTIFWDDYKTPTLSDVNLIKIAHKSGTNWLNEGGTTSGNLSSGSVTSNTLTTWSPFTLGLINPCTNPLSFNVIGGGTLCSNDDGGTMIGLSGSEIGVTYQLMRDAIPEGLPINGTGSGLVFGNFSLAGTYTVVASKTSGGCLATMTGSAIITLMNCCNNTLYVNTNVSGGTGDGSSWANAYASLSDALAKAHICNQAKTIKVATGTYKPTKQPFNGGVELNTGNNRDMSFHIPDGVTIEGGYNASTGMRDITINKTTLSGDIGTIGNSSDNCYHVVIAVAPSSGGQGVSIDGFSITDGNANGPGAININTSISQDYGAGINMMNGINVISNNIIHNNYAENAGSGIFLQNSNNTLAKNIIFNNTSNTYGGGIYSLYGSNNFSNNVIFNNSAEYQGGGISVSLNSNNILTSNTFHKNSANSKGGGYSAFSTSSTLQNNIFWENKKGTSTNSSGADISESGGSLTMTYSLTQTYGTSIANGNIVGANPLFLNPTDLDGADNILRTDDDGLRLKIGSPALDAGILISSDNTDILGAMRPQGNGYDMGAYEGSVIVCTPPTVYTVNGSGAYCSNQASNVEVSLSGSETGVTYQLKNGTNNVGFEVNGTGSTLSFGNQIAGTYTVVATRTIGGCTATMSGSAIVISNNIPTANIAVANNCGNSILDLTTSANSFIWSNGATTQDITVSSAGNYSVTVTDNNSCSTTANGTANPKVFPSANIAVTDNCGNSILDLTTSANSFIWSNGATTQDITVSSAGNYSVTVTDSNSCSTTAIGNANPKAFPSANIAVTDNCGNSILDLTTSANSFIWSNGATTQDITVSSAGNYSVTVTDNNSCSTTANGTANPKVFPSANIVVTNNCGNSILDLTTSANSFIWSNGATTQDITVSSAGNYSVTVTDNNSCSTTAIGNANPKVFPSANIAVTDNCGNSILDLTTSANSFIWSNGATTQDITVSSAGNYSVTVTDNNSCSTTAIGNANPKAFPSANIAVTDNCGNSILDLTTSANSFIWSNGATTQDITVSSAGNYFVTVTDSNSCSTTAIGNANPKAFPSANIAVANNCGNSILDLTTSANSFIWSNGATTQDITVSSAGNYFVTVTDSNSCSTTAIGNANPKVFPSANIAVANNCGNSILDLTTSANSFIWSNGATTQDITVSSAGNYSVTVTDNNSCSTTANGTANPKIFPSANIVVTNNCGNSILDLTTSANSFIWSYGATTQDITVSSAGNYSVTVTDNNSCSTTAIGNANPKAFPSANIAVANNCGNSILDLTTSANSFIWSNGATTQDITVSSAGNYSVTVTDSNSCSTIAIGNANPKAFPSANIVVTDNCGNSILDLTTSANSFIWSNGATTQDITVSSAGNYSVTVTDSNSCSTTAIGNANPKIILTLSISKIENCGNTILEANNGFNSYLWSNGSTTSNITINYSNTFSVSATAANGCTASASVDVIIRTLPGLKCSNDITVCEGSTVSYIAATTGNVTNSISQTTSNSIVDYYGVSCSNQSNLVGVNAYGRLFNLNSNTTSFLSEVTFGVENCSLANLPVQVKVYKYNGVLTYGSMTLLGTTNSTLPKGRNYYHSVSLNTYIPTGTNAIFVEYVVTGNSSFQFFPGTNSQGQTNLSYFSAPNCAIPNPISYSTIGFNNSHLVLNIKLKDAVTPTQLAGLPSGSSFPVGVTTVTHSATSVYNCTETCSFNVTVLPKPIINAGEDITVNCNTPSTTLIATGGVAYVWNNNATQGNSVNPTTTTTYTVTATNSSGCTATDDIQVTVDKNPPTAFSLTGGYLCANSTASTNINLDNSQNNVIYQLQKNNNNIGNPITGTGSPISFNVQTLGNYAVIATSSNGCTTLMSNTFNVINDIVAPTFGNIPAEITISQDSIPAFAAHNLVANDNNGVPTISYLNETVNNLIKPSCYVTYYRIIRTYQATDICNNTATATHSILVADLVNMSCPNNLTINTNNDGFNDFNCSSLVVSANNVSPTYTDICNKSQLSYLLSGATVGNGSGSIAGVRFNSGVTQVRYTSSIPGTSIRRGCVFNITVEDKEAPRINLSNTSVVLNSCSFPTNLPNQPTASDNCSTATLTIQSDETVSLLTTCKTATSDKKYSTKRTITWKATDALGLTSTSTQVFYLLDNIAPTASCKNDITIGIGSANVTVSPSVLNNMSSDNCSGSLTFQGCNSSATCTNFTSVLTFTKSMLGVANIKQIPVNLRVLDACNNASTCSTTVTLMKANITSNEQNINLGDILDDETIVPSEKSNIEAGHGSLRCYPNPFSEDLNLEFNLTQDVERLVLKIYDNQGRLVETNERGEAAAGFYQMRWNLASLSVGMYLVCLETDGNCTKMERVILMK